MTEWISVDEKLPDDEKEDGVIYPAEWFIIRAKLKAGTIESYFCGWFDGDGWMVSLNRPVTTRTADNWQCWMYPLDSRWEVTHWMKLKEVPRPEKDET